jgi:hypothetical protein
MSRMQEFSIIDTQTGGRQSIRFGYNPQDGGTFEPIVPPISRSIDEDSDATEDDSSDSYSHDNDMSGGGKRDRIEQEALNELLGHSVVNSKQSGGESLIPLKIKNSPVSIQKGGCSDDESAPADAELKLMTDPGIIRDEQGANVTDLAHDNILGGSRKAPDTKQAWWKQSGGCAESNSHCGTSSIENIVSGFVNDALQGGKRAAKKNMRRPVSSASSDTESQSDSDDASSSEEEVAPKKGKKTADKKDKPARAPTDWMIYLSKVRETVGTAENANKVALLTAFASSYKKAAEAQGKTGKDLYKVALDSFLAEWKSGVGKKKLAAAKPKEK